MLKSALEVDLSQRTHTLADKMHDWAKKINRDKDIRNLQLDLVAAAGVDIAKLPKDSRGRPLPTPFIKVDERSAAGAQVLVSIPYLPISELDWNETMYSLIGAWVR